MELASSSRPSSRQSSAVSSSSRDKCYVGYTSDLEGGWEAWKIYLKNSKVLQYDEAAHTISLKPNCIFIHGGDVCDRGSGDLRILRDLLALKSSAPDRVFFVIGNRDANKLRLPFSLCESVVATPPLAYWVPPGTGSEEAALLDRVNRLKWLLKYTMGAPFAFECRREELEALGRPHSDEDVVQSFLDLVSPSHPDNLLLQYLEQAQMSVIVEDTIYVHGAINDYYLSWVPPRIGDRSKVQSLTPELNKSNCSLDVFQWTRELNAFAASEIQDYKEHCDEFLSGLQRPDAAAALWDAVGHYGHPQPGSRLVQCGMGILPDKSDNPGVIYGGYLMKGEPISLAETAALWLKCDGINKIVVGHQPNGDAPFIMDQQGVQVVSADTSYSKGVLYNKRDLFRSPLYTSLVGSEEGDVPTAAGDAYCTIDTFIKEEMASKIEITPSINPSPVTPSAAKANTRILPAWSEVCVEYSSAPRVFINASSTRPSEGPQAGKLVIQGVLAQGSCYSFVVPASAANSFIGKKTSENWYVKASGIEIGGQRYYLLSHSKGFDFRDRLVKESELEKEGLVSKRH